MKRSVLFAGLLIFVFMQKGYAWESRELYYRGVESARAGEKDFAFMNFHEIVTSQADSKYFKNSLFSLGEYYFFISDYNDSVLAFKRFLGFYPASEARVFALAYLMKMAKDQGKDDQAELLEKEIIRFKQTGLLFKEFNEYKYTSAFSKEYKALYYIDRIEIYVNNEIFAKIIL